MRLHFQLDRVLLIAVKYESAKQHLTFTNYKWSFSGHAFSSTQVISTPIWRLPWLLIDIILCIPASFILSLCWHSLEHSKTLKPETGLYGDLYFIYGVAQWGIVTRKLDLFLSEASLVMTSWFLVISGNCDVIDGLRDGIRQWIVKLSMKPVSCYSPRSYVDSIGIRQPYNYKYLWRPHVCVLVAGVLTPPSRSSLFLFVKCLSETNVDQSPRD